MSETNYINSEARDVLKATSRTFYIPISHLTKGLQEAVASAYLCMRAIDEIEDHPELPSSTKRDLLLSVSQIMQRKPFNEDELKELFEPYQSLLPKVTLQLGNWIKDLSTDDFRKCLRIDIYYGKRDGRMGPKGLADKK